MDFYRDMPRLLDRHERRRRSRRAADGIAGLLFAGAVWCLALGVIALVPWAW